MAFKYYFSPSAELKTIHSDLAQHTVNDTPLQHPLPVTKPYPCLPWRLHRLHPLPSPKAMLGCAYADDPTPSARPQPLILSSPVVPGGVCSCRLRHMRNPTKYTHTHRYRGERDKYRIGGQFCRFKIYNSCCVTHTLNTHWLIY